MKLLESLDQIDQSTKDAFVVHEKFERWYDIHSHNRDQLSYVEDGVAYITIEGEYLVVPARHFLWIPAHVKHELKVSHSATQLHSFYFKRLEGEFYQRIGIYPASNLIIELIKFSEIWTNQFINYTETHGQVLSTLLNLLPFASNHQIKLQLPTSEHPKIKNITNYIHEQFYTNLTLNELTEKFNMSERTFCRLFKKELHTTFIQYLKTYRIIQAISMLQQKKDSSIEEIANATGYESIAAFSNIFLEYTGMRPSQMRKIIT